MQWSSGAEQFVSALASADPTPGGGSAAAMAGAMGCALLLMAAQTTLKRKGTSAENQAKLQTSIKKLNSLHVELKAAIEKDALAYQAYITARKLPKEDPARTQALQDALWTAAKVPADTATVCQHVLKELAVMENWIDKIIISDVICARQLFRCAVNCCPDNIRTNAAYITQTDRLEKLQKILNSLEPIH